MTIIDFFLHDKFTALFSWGFVTINVLCKFLHLVINPPFNSKWVTLDKVIIPFFKTTLLFHLTIYFNGKNLNPWILAYLSLLIDPFVPYAPFLYLMKTSENLAVFCFRGVEKGWIANEWVNPTSLDKEWITDGNNSDRIVGIFIYSITSMKIQFHINPSHSSYISQKTLKRGNQECLTILTEKN